MPKSLRAAISELKIFTYFTQETPQNFSSGLGWGGMPVL